MNSVKSAWLTCLAFPAFALQSSCSGAPDGGVQVIIRGFSVDAAEWDEATGKAYFTGDANVGQLKVSFFGPFYGGYNVIELDKVDYQYSLVAGPDRDYLWLLSRTPSLDPATVKKLVGKAADLGFATDDLIFVDQSPLPSKSVVTAIVGELIDRVAAPCKS
jgi:lipocalin